MRIKQGLLVGSLLAIGCSTAGRSSAQTTKPATIEWDSSSLNYVGPGGYARIARVSSSHLLLCVEDRGRSWVRRSDDDGKAWGEPILAATFADGAAANPELLVLRDGTVWLLYNERPRSGSGKPFTIRLAVSKDAGKTWTPQDEPIYVAGTRGEEGCWEPSAIELPDGEILVFFANEAPYRKSDEQEITMLRTRDVGGTFSDSITLAFRTGARDGMPVPARLEDGSVAIAIEDSGFTPDGQMKPVILRLELPLDTRRLPLKPRDANRWHAVDREWPAGLYAGAPYLVTMPDGTPLLSVQSVEFDHEQRMVVYVGEKDAWGFASPTQPFPVDSGRSGKWNSLFVKDARTLTAISTTTIGGRTGIWTIDGRLRN